MTVLTSYDDHDLADAGYAYGVRDLVARCAAQAREAGLDGLILSAEEAGAVRARHRPADDKIIRPGGNGEVAEAIIAEIAAVQS